MLIYQRVNHMKQYLEEMNIHEQQPFWCADRRPKRMCFSTWTFPFGWYDESSYEYSRSNHIINVESHRNHQYEYIIYLIIIWLHIYIYNVYVYIYILCTYELKNLPRALRIWGSFPLIEVTGVPPGNRYARPSYFGIADFKVGRRQQKMAEERLGKSWEHWIHWIFVILGHSKFCLGDEAPCRLAMSMWGPAEVLTNEYEAWKILDADLHPVMDNVQMMMKLWQVCKGLAMTVEKKHPHGWSQRCVDPLLDHGFWASISEGRDQISSKVIKCY